MFQRPLSLIVYVAENGCAAEVHKFIHKHHRYANVEVLNTTETLCHRVRQNGRQDMIVILLIASRGELAKIIQQADLFCDHQIILVLPDRSPESASLGHALYPRYVSYHDGDLQDVDCVLQRMLERKGRCSKAINRIIYKFIKKGVNHEPNRRAAARG